MYPEQPPGVPMQPPGVPPEQHVAYQPYSAEPSTWSAPPMMPGQPGGYPPMSAPVRRSAKVPVLIGAIAVLALALIIVGAAGITRINRLRHDAAALKSRNETVERQDNEAAAALRDRFKAVDLNGKLARVKDLDRAADDVFKQWDSATAKFGALAKAIAVCDDAVDDYDRTAAPFPASMFTDLPQKIDLTRLETDCGRAFTSRI